MATALPVEKPRSSEWPTVVNQYENRTPRAQSIGRSSATPTYPNCWYYCANFSCPKVVSLATQSGSPTSAQVPAFTFIKRWNPRSISKMKLLLVEISSKYLRTTFLCFSVSVSQNAHFESFHLYVLPLHKS